MSQLTLVAGTGSEPLVPDGAGVGLPVGVGLSEGLGVAPSAVSLTDVV